MKYTLALILVLSFVVALLAAEETKEIAITGEDELVQQKGAFKVTWVHPDADITRYDKLYEWEPMFQFRKVEDGRSVVSQSQMLSGEYDSMPVSEEAQEKFAAIVTEAVHKELSRSKKFKLVNKIKPGTLIIRGAWADIVSSVPPRTTGTYDVHLSSVGEATFIFELIDAESGVIQARIAERRLIQPPSRMHQVSATPSTSATVWNDVKIWAADVARDLRTALDKAKKKAEKDKK